MITAKRVETIGGPDSSPRGHLRIVRFTWVELKNDLPTAALRAYAEQSLRPRKEKSMKQT